jgi:hypothetical protein
LNLRKNVCIQNHGFCSFLTLSKLERHGEFFHIVPIYFGKTDKISLNNVSYMYYKNRITYMYVLLMFRTLYAYGNSKVHTLTLEKCKVKIREFIRRNQYLKMMRPRNVKTKSSRHVFYQAITRFLSININHTFTNICLQTRLWNTKANMLNFSSPMCFWSQSAANQLTANCTKIIKSKTYFKVFFFFYII